MHHGVRQIGNMFSTANELLSHHSTYTALLLVLDLGKKGESSTDGKLQVFYVGTTI